jgi:hypothetical protein
VTATDPAVARWRLHAQQAARPAHVDPAEVVRRLGAVQSQDYVASTWAVGLRTRRATASTVEQALAERTIVRTHFMRNTVHLVAAEDLRWMLRLVAPRIRMVIDSIGRAARLDLDEGVYARSNEVIGDALAGGRQLTRPELAERLEAAGISTAGRLTLLTQRAQTDGIVCHATRYGLALTDEWLRPGRDLRGDEALAELARRYFRGHGPATVRDFAWWCGLTLTDCRRAVAAVAPDLERVVIGGEEHLADGPPPGADPAEALTHLLGNYDEYTVGYKDRSAVFDAAHRAKVDTPGHNILFTHAVVVDGEILGTWKRRGAAVTARLFQRVTAAQEDAVEAAARRYGTFLGAPVALSLAVG